MSGVIPLQQMSGTLLDLILYLALVALGAFLGSRPQIQSLPMPWLGRFQTAALLLIVTLGAELGSNEEIISSLGTIGLNALAVTLTSMVGSMLAVHALRKYLLKLNAQGRSCQEAPEDSDPGSGEAVHVDHSLTFAIVFTVAAGILAGRFLLPDAAVAHCGTVIRWGLYLLLFLVGLDMGRQGSLIRDIRAAGLRVLLVPLAVMAGTFAVTALVGLFLPLGPKDCVAAAAGFGWYSLAPTLLAPYSLTVSATAFLSNIMHELFSIVAVPIVAQKLGYIEAVALPGATAMDTLLPVVVSATADRMAIYSFASGLILSLAVPVLVPAIIALPSEHFPEQEHRLRPTPKPVLYFSRMASTRRSSASASRSERPSIRRHLLSSLLWNTRASTERSRSSIIWNRRGTEGFRREPSIFFK